MAGHVISADCNIKLVITATQRYVEHVLVGVACGGEEAWPRHLMNTTHTDTQRCKAWPHIS